MTKRAMARNAPSEGAVSRRVKCDYCDRAAKRVTGKTVYPHRPDLFAKPFWACMDCGAWVGCHPGTDNPLGRLANAALRKAKMAAHSAFDPLWRNGSMKRAEAYKWLAGQMGIAPQNCHIGMFDEDRCAAVVEIVTAARQA